MATAAPPTKGSLHDPSWERIDELFEHSPIGFAGGDYNLSRYVGNAPPTLRDPSGLEPAGLDMLGDRLGEMANSPEARQEAARIGDAIRHTF